MRRLPLLLAVLLVSPVYAQVSGGGIPVATTSSPQADVQPTFVSSSYLRAGTVAPSGAYGSLTPNARSIEQAFESGRGADGGGFVELGGTRYLWASSSLPIAAGVTWGLSGTLYTVNSAEFYDVREEDVTTTGADAVLDFRIGGALAAQPVDGLVVEASVKIGPGVAALEEAAMNTGANFLVDAPVNDESLVAFSTFTSGGLSVGYAGFVLGVETHAGEVAFERSVTGDLGSSQTYTADVRMASSRLYVGLRF